MRALWKRNDVLAPPWSPSHRVLGARSLEPRPGQDGMPQRPLLSAGPLTPTLCFPLCGGRGPQPLMAVRFSSLLSSLPAQGTIPVNPAAAFCRLFHSGPSFPKGFIRLVLRAAWKGRRQPQPQAAAFLPSVVGSGYGICLTSSVSSGGPSPPAAPTSPSSGDYPGGRPGGQKETIQFLVFISR